ncbi:proteobacterial dedicated sortase system histidine kinase [Teredinibacter haidensis]|uniref:proteobacterial dedicated sortase system histidine kinase n=1 Tax=Teredinibacter haidensis TaxID=2731755 RepID=UPI000948DFBE|nr:proteobacterial dedicated sortase system histidine kinase [Teredinibacter haidensis]
MKLRKQLLIVSLITLTLPWVGCQYIQEMESTLRKGQTDALAATAKAVAARLGSDPDTVRRLTSFNPPAGSTPLYAHQLDTPPILDSYDDEWLSYSLSRQSLLNSRGEEMALLLVAVTDNTPFLYLLIQVKDAQRHYFNPTLQSPLASDHLQLHLKRGEQHERLIIYSSGSGDLHAAWQQESGSLQMEYQASGTSSEWPQGYQMEMRLPLSWVRQGIGIDINDANTIRPSASNLGIDHQLPPLISNSPDLSRELEIFQRSGVQLSIATRGLRPIALSGDLLTPESSQLETRHNFLNWFYRAALGNQRLPQLDNHQRTGRLDSSEARQALDTGFSDNAPPSHGWYQQGKQKLVRVSLPIFDLASKEKGPIGIIVADQSADSLATLTSSAFYRLLFYSLVVTFAASISLILYASWLSLRIRRLSHAAASAITDSGKIAESFPIFKSQDEIGDLSRNYALLLTRLREYTNYLRSLSSKLSHELRTPLAIVKSSLENLEHEELTPKAKIYAERAKEGTTRLSNILNAMSAASRVEQAIGAAELETIPCDELLTNLKEAYGDVYQNASFNLKIRHDDGPLTLLGSGELLVQMFDKLVDNAADFCPQGGRIEIGLYRHHDTLVFTVHNEGPPLPKHMHGQLFDSMVSVREKKSNNTENGQHLGLGLYIVRLIADFHRGEVQCYNVPDNSGVIFEIRLPAA